MLQLFDLRGLSKSYLNRRSSDVLICELSPERDNEVNELPADPGPVPQRGVVVHPLPRDGDEGGVYILITHLDRNNAEILQCYPRVKFSKRPFEWSRA